MRIRELKSLAQGYIAFLSVIVCNMYLGLSGPKSHTCINILSKKLHNISLSGCAISLFSFVYLSGEPICMYLFTDFFSSRITYLYKNLSGIADLSDVNILRLFMHIFILLFKMGKNNFIFWLILFSTQKKVSYFKLHFLVLY